MRIQCQEILSGILTLRAEIASAIQNLMKFDCMDLIFIYIYIYMNYYVSKQNAMYIHVRKGEQELAVNMSSQPDFYSK